MRAIGYGKQADSIIHLAYEHVWLEGEHSEGAAGDGSPEGAQKFSGRSGTWMGYTADDLYSEALKRAESRIKPKVSGSEMGRIATAIAAAAVRFSFLKTTPEKKIIFRWEDAFSLGGDSAPYVIYAHARAHKIFEKAGEGRAGRLPDLVQQEKELLRKIMLFDWVVSEACRHLRPHMLAEYCLDLATCYNKFYNACPILSCGNEELKEARLAMNFAALCTMKNALGAIGIEALERM